MVRATGRSKSENIPDTQSSGFRPRWLRIPAEVVQRDPGGLLIDLHCKNAISPKVVEISEDPRKLALCTLTITNQDFTK
jgi:hypothetical protein